MIWLMFWIADKEMKVEIILAQFNKQAKRLKKNMTKFN